MTTPLAKAQAQVANYIADTVTWDSMLHRVGKRKPAREALRSIRFGPNRANRRAAARR